VEKWVDEQLVSLERKNDIDKKVKKNVILKLKLTNSQRRAENYMYDFEYIDYVLVDEQCSTIECACQPPPHPKIRIDLYLYVTCHV
jgi:hypothetical protein